MNNLFALAEMQLIKERNNNYTLIDILDYAVKIRKYLDYQERGKTISQAKRRI